MINIDDEDFDDETFGERLFEKADYIGEIVTGKRKIHLAIPKKDQIQKKSKPSNLAIFIKNIKKSLAKYKNMSLPRIIGLIIILLLSICIIAFVGYLLFLLLTSLVKLGVIGLIGFSIFMCAISVSGILLLASRYTQK